MANPIWSVNWFVGQASVTFPNKDGFVEAFAEAVRPWMSRLARPLFLQGSQALLERGQIMALPDGEDTGRRNEEASLAQFIASSHLPMGSCFDGVGENRHCRRFFPPVLQLGFALLAIEQGFEAPFGKRILVAVESVAGQAHHLAGFRDLTQFGGQIRQTDLVTDDILVKTTHGLTPGRSRAVLMKIRPSIKTANPTHWQDPTVRSGRNFYI
jgi:hypothetical protein